MKQGLEKCNGITRGSKWSKCEICSLHKLDEKDSLVGAASIIAKKVRDDEVEKLSKQVGINLGSGYPADPLTKIAIRELCNLEMPHECLRWSWSNVKRVWIRKIRDHYQKGTWMREKRLKLPFMNGNSKNGEMPELLGIIDSRGGKNGMGF